VNKTMLAYRPLSSQFWSLDFFFSQWRHLIYENKCASFQGQPVNSHKW
jgi:hypothetical protein